MSTHLLDSLAADLAALEMLTAAIKLKIEALQLPEPAESAVPVTTKRMPKHVIANVISTQLPLFVESRSQYHVSEFRKQCCSLLPIGTADKIPDKDSRERWIGRFNYSHNQIALLRGFTTDGNGNWSVPSEAV